MRKIASYKIERFRQNLLRKCAGDLIIKSDHKLDDGELALALNVADDYVKRQNQKELEEDRKLDAKIKKDPRAQKFLKDTNQNIKDTGDSLVMGPITTTLLSALVGGGLGYGAHRLGYSMTGHPGKDILGGAAAGAGAGILSSVVGGMIGSAARKRNPDKADLDLFKHDINGDSNWASYLVPGVAGYRMGYWSD